jgi:hypothetical protein
MAWTPKMVQALLLKVAPPKAEPNLKVTASSRPARQLSGRAASASEASGYGRR